MVYRVYVEKKPGQRHEADGLLKEVREFLQIKGLTSLRVLNRYDVDRIEEDLFRYAVNTVFSEPQVDDVSFDVPAGEQEQVAAIVTGEMENVIKLSIPLVAECGEGKNWLEAH